MPKLYFNPAWTKVRPLLSNLVPLMNCLQLSLTFLSDTIERLGLSMALNVINEEFGGWPILDENHKEKYTILEKLILLRRYSSSQIIDVAVGLNPKNPKEYIMRVKSWKFESKFKDSLSLSFFFMVHRSRSLRGSSIRST